MRLKQDARPTPWEEIVLGPVVVLGAPDPTVPLITAAVGNTGDVAMNAPAARSMFHLTGAGIKIGIISDSFAINATQAAQEEANGDLPSQVTVLKDWSTGNDEGRAMAELVHKVAPGAQLLFSTAEGGEQSFANSILNLKAAGCSIIVDDVTYYAEPFFQDGNVIQSAVESVIASGVNYFTAAGNEGNNFFESAINVHADRLPDGSIGLVQHYTGGGDTQSVTVAAYTTIVIDLQWDQPFLSNDGSGTGSGPGSAFSLELLLFSGATLVASQSANLTGSDPVQALQFSNSNATAASYQLAIVSNGFALPSGTLKYIIFGNAVINDSAAGLGSGTVIGHALVGSANTVGAAYAATPSTAESYSSVGSGTIEIDAAGSRLATPIVENKVNFTAPDGIATSVSTSNNSFVSFFGTSAAAPGAAAVAALMQQANPNLTPAEITSAIEQTATPMGDGVSKDGAGFVNADAAVANIYGDAWATPSGGSWSTAAGWTQGRPAAGTYVTLSDDAGALTSSYAISIETSEAARTLTVGTASSIAAGLSIVAAGTLAISESATIGRAGTMIVAGKLLLAGALRVQDTATSSGLLSIAKGGHVSAGDLVLNGGRVSIAAGGALSLSDTTGLAVTLGTLSIVGTASTSGGLTGAGSVLLSGTLNVARGLVGATITLAANGLLMLTATDSGILTAGFTSIIGHTAGQPGRIDLTGLSGTDTLSYSTSTTTLTISAGTIVVARLHFRTGQGLTAASFSRASDGTGGLLVTIACFIRGTRIATPRGLVAIEDLRIGDAVLTASLRARPIRWIGRRSYPAALSLEQPHIRPIRVRADALEPGRPYRDLMLSPEHALMFTDALVPVRCLVNGSSIAPTPAGAALDYFHIELPTHDIILAEGTPVESFNNHLGRALFDNAHEFAFVDGDDPAPQADCAPRLTDGAIVARWRAAIDARAGLTPGPLSGSLERVDAMTVSGWARDDHAVDAPVALRISAGERELGVTIADRYRADLHGRHGFDLVLAEPLDPGRPHIVAVRRASDGAMLPGSPIVIGPAPPIRTTAASADQLLGELDRLIERRRFLVSANRSG